jgi:glycosyltransferase involved in cell wall biosynthesis
LKGALHYSPNLETPPIEDRPLSEDLAMIDAPAIVCLSHLRWKFVLQRPQHLMTRAARTHKVFFVEEPVFGSIVPQLNLDVQQDGVTVATPFLQEGMRQADQCAVQRTMLDSIVARFDPLHLTLWYYTPMALAFSSHLDCSACVYDNMDDLSAFRFAPARLTDYEAMLMARSDIVFTGGHSLYRAKRDLHPSVFAFPSSVDSEHFARARARSPQPDDQAAIEEPRIGFFGVIDERIDLGLLEEAARMKPDWSFVMLGPTAKIDASVLPRRENIHWLGSKPYAALPSYLSGWNAGMMPFALNEATRFISPTKTPEFLAAGVPVVSTPIQDVVASYGDIVEIASSPQAFVEGLERAMTAPRDRWLADVDERLAGMSWDVTWSSMLSLVEQCRAAKAKATARMTRPEEAAAPEIAHV